MKVKLKMHRVGTQNGVIRTWEKGEEVELPDAEAQRLIEAGQAEPVRKDKTKA